MPVSGWTTFAVPQATARRAHSSSEHPRVSAVAKPASRQSPAPTLFRTGTSGPIIVQVSLALAYAILAEAALSFLGLGTQPPTPTWGSMLSFGREFVREAPWFAFFPGFAIFLTVLSLNLVGDGLSDALDPRL